MKKIISLLLVIALTAAISIGGTVAYLTDNDSQVNTFTNGNVKIDLWEDFGDNDAEGIEKLMPTTGKNEDGSQKNGIEKEVYVTNTGSEDAYVRVHIAIPSILDNATDASANALHFNYKNDNVGEGLWDWSKTTGADYTGDWNVYSAAIDGIDYNVYVVTYESALKSGETTVDAIWQVYMDSGVTNEDIAKFNETLGSEWKILVAAEAGQAAGYDDAYTALNTQFGVPGEYTIENWDLRKDKVFENYDPVYVSTYEELAAALKKGGKIIIESDITVESADVMTASNGTTKAKLLVEDVAVELDLNGHKITLDSENTNIRTMGTANLIITDSSVEGTGEISTNSAQTRMMSTQDDSVVTILGGTFTNTNTDAAGYNGFSSYNNSVLNIYGGKFYIPSEKDSSGSWLLHNYNSKINVYGGEFYSHNPAMGRAGTMYYGSKLVAEGYYAYDMGDNWYGIQEGLNPGQVAVNEYAFDSFEDAIANGKARRSGVVDYHIAGEVSIDAGTDISAVNKGYASKVATVNVVGINAGAKIVVSDGNALTVADGVTLNITDVQVVVS